MRKILKKYREIRYPYNPLVNVVVFRNNLLHNWDQYYNNNQKIQIAPVLKSNAYGHGLFLVADILKEKDMPFMVVDTFYEALVLRNNGIKTKILIVGYTLPDNIYRNLLKNISYTVTSLDQLKDISSNIRQNFTFHLKVDTGMHRQGLLINQVDEAINIIKKNRYLHMEGLCSHLADSSNQDYSLAQIKSWNNLVDKVKKELPQIKYFHLAASDGIIYSDQIKSNVCRVGLALYGISSRSNSHLDLKPSLSLRSIISSIKSLKPGDKVGYDCTYTAKNHMKIATVPIGYYEGIDLRLSNNGFFKVNNHFCPIVGRVSMNITVIDVTEFDNIKVGDQVIAISENPTDNNSVQNISKTIDTVPYEVLVKIPSQLRRHLV